MQQDLAKKFRISHEVELLKERRFLERVCVTLLTNEKESAIHLRRESGEMDYVGFFGTDEKFRKWTRDLFMYCWDRAERWYPGIQIK